MMKHVWGATLIAAIAACGGGGGGGGGGGNGSDGGTGDGGTPLICQPYEADGQQGCPSGEKCSWTVDSETTGHLGCIADGSAQLGSACSFSGSDGSGFPTGTDNCIGGTYCSTTFGICETICDPNDGSGNVTCDSQHSCATYVDNFNQGTTFFAGVCEPTCDVLTQTATAPIAGITTACGSPNPCFDGSAGSGSGSGTCSADGPQLGCYPSFLDDTGACTNTPEGRGHGSDAATDQVDCLADNNCAVDDSGTAGTQFINGCAPGFVALIPSSDNASDTKIACAALCAPLDKDITTPQNEEGDGSALGKLPGDVAPVAGHANCAIGKRAKSAGEECRYLQDYFSDDLGSNFQENLGACWSPSNFHFDPTGGSNDTTPVPACDTLRAGSADDAEMGPDNVPCSGSNGSETECFAVAFGCYSPADSQDTGSGSGSARAAHRVKMHQPSDGPQIMRFSSKTPFRRAGGIH